MACLGSTIFLCVYHNSIAGDYIMDRLSYEIIKNVLESNNLNGYDVIYLEETQSTNDYAKKEPLNKAFNNIIVADSQTQGRGRLGRSFLSRKGEGIFMTLVVRPQKEMSQVAGITLVTAMALSKALDRVTGLKTKIKWPNDIILNGKKVSGILTELKNVSGEPASVIVGIGINVYNRDFEGELGKKATSLFMEMGEGLPKRADIIAEIVKSFQEYYESFIENENLSFMLTDYNDRLINYGKEVVANYRGEQKTGRQLGISEDGALQVLIEGRVENIASGEIFIRGVEGYV